MLLSSDRYNGLAPRKVGFSIGYINCYAFGANDIIPDEDVCS